MSIRLKTKNTIKRLGQKELNYWLVYTIVFLFMCALVYHYFLFNGKFFIWDRDGENQHLASLTYFGIWMRDVIRNLFTNHSFNIATYSFGLGYGGDVVQILHYYTIGDPLNLLSVFVPSNLTIVLYHVLIILRLYLAGVAFSKMCFYFNRNREPLYVVAGAVSCIFCGFLLFAGTRHPYFIDPLIYFPMIVVGVEKIRKKETPLIFALGVFIAAASNFYFFYMTVIFTVLFVILRLVFVRKEMNFKDGALFILKLGVFSVMGVAMAGVVFLPVLLQFFNDPRASSDVSYHMLYDLRYYEKFPQAFISYDSTSTGWTFIGCGGIALPALFTLFVKRKKRTFLKAAFIILTVFFLIPFFGHIFNGMSYVANRWEWVYAILVAYIITDTAEEVVSLSRKELVSCFVLIIAYVVFCFVMNVTVTESSQSQIILALALIFILLIMLTGDRKFKRAKALLILTAVVVGVGINAYFEYSPNETDFLTEYKNLHIFRTHFYHSEASLLKEKFKTKDFYRYTGPSLRYNMSLLSGNSSTQYYFSLSNSNIFQFFDEMSLYTSMGQMYVSLDERTALNELANVKYYVSKINEVDETGIKDRVTKRIPYDYNTSDPKVWYSSNKSGFKKVDKNFDEDSVLESYTVYSNNNPLPFGYTYDSYINREDYTGLNSMQKQETMLQSVVLDRDTDIVKENPSPNLTSKEIKYRVIPQDEKVAQLGNSFVSAAQDTKIDFEFEGMENCETYFMITGLTFKGTNPIDIYSDDPSVDVNNYYDKDKWNSYTEYKRNKIRKYSKYYVEPNKTVIHVETGEGEEKIAKNIDYRTPYDNYYENRHDFSVNLNYSTTAKNKITITLPHRGVYSFKDVKIICQPMSNYTSQVNALKKDHLQKVDFHKYGDSAATNEITGEISLKENKILLLSIPYSDGWTAYVDGKKVDILRANTMFSALELKAGKHKIRLHYTTPGLKIGIALSGLGFAVFIAILVVSIVSRKKRKKQETAVSKE